MYYTFLFISGQEFIIVALVVLMLFGSKKIPEFARGLGKGMREFRKAADDIKKEFDHNTSDVVKDVKEVKKDITSTTSSLSKNINKFNDGLKP